MPPIRRKIGAETNQAGWRDARRGHAIPFFSSRDTPRRCPCHSQTQPGQEEEVSPVTGQEQCTLCTADAHLASGNGQEPRRESDQDGNIDPEEARRQGNGMDGRGASANEENVADVASRPPCPWRYRCFGAGPRQSSPRIQGTRSRRRLPSCR